MGINNNMNEATQLTASIPSHSNLVSRVKPNGNRKFGITLRIIDERKRRILRILDTNRSTRDRGICLSLTYWRLAPNALNNRSCRSMSPDYP